jgi:hypothetical protein
MLRNRVISRFLMMLVAAAAALSMFAPEALAQCVYTVSPESGSVLTTPVKAPFSKTITLTGVGKESTFKVTNSKLPVPLDIQKTGLTSATLSTGTFALEEIGDFDVQISVDGDGCETLVDYVIRVGEGLHPHVRADCFFACYCWRRIQRRVVQDLQQRRAVYFHNTRRFTARGNVH